MQQLRKDLRKIMLILTVGVLLGLMIWAFIRDKGTPETSNTGMNLPNPTAAIDYSGLNDLE